MRFVFIIGVIVIAMLGIVATVAYRQDWRTPEDVSDALDDALDDAQAALPAG